jgi:nitroimidazol reductase NimA-like FMN-containing flavoprotein (pyridoxamine 5'-phosphate oxidase superfamily)
MTADSSFPVTPINRVRRKSERASYERAAAYAILDEALVATVSFVWEGEPCAIPMAFARWDDQLVLHGSSKSRLIESLALGSRIAVCVTLVDGLVLARSVMHHSMNYRSVVVFGEARELVERDEKLAALRCIVDHVHAGRWQAARAPDELELRATRVVALPLETASVKQRSGGPIDDAEDLELPYWAGVIPLRVTRGEAIPEPLHAPRCALPAELSR